MDIKRGQVYYCDLSPVVGSEQGGLRPCVIVSNNKGNHFSPVVIVAPLTTRINKCRLPTQVLTADGKSMIMCEQIRVIDKRRISGERYTILAEETMAQVDAAIKISLGV